MMFINGADAMPFEQPRYLYLSSVDQESVANVAWTAHMDIKVFARGADVIAVSGASNNERAMAVTRIKTVHC
jgi:hypothetical protein